MPNSKLVGDRELKKHLEIVETSLFEDIVRLIKTKQSLTDSALKRKISTEINYKLSLFPIPEDAQE